jgi:hypothetical protein
MTAIFWCLTLGLLCAAVALAAVYFLLSRIEKRLNDLSRRRP